MNAAVLTYGALVAAIVCEVIATSFLQQSQQFTRLLPTVLMALFYGAAFYLLSFTLRALPVGVPKLLVSTVAAGDTRPYIGGVDMTLMYSVVDIAGINQISAQILANAAGAMVNAPAAATMKPMPRMRAAPAARRIPSGSPRPIA